MKLFVMFAVLSSSFLFGADAPDRSGKYLCKCDTIHCENDPSYTFVYDQKTQFLSGEGPSWKVSGYAMRQESKVTGVVFLILPAAISFSRETVVFSADGRVSARGGSYLCTWSPETH